MFIPNGKHYISGNLQTFLRFVTNPHYLWQAMPKLCQQRFPVDWVKFANISADTAQVQQNANVETARVRLGYRTASNYEAQTPYRQEVNDD
jgi:hypothetical protein